jgi:hypothetical protein
MAFTNAFRDHMAKAAIGDTVTPFNASNAYIGVGDSSAAFAADQADLQGSNKFRKAMEAGYPIRSGNTMTFRALFGTGDANFAWNEWGVFNAATGGTMMNRRVEALGTKTSAQSWELTVSVTLNVS